MSGGYPSIITKIIPDENDEITRLDMFYTAHLGKRK